MTTVDVKYELWEDPEEEDPEEEDLWALQFIFTTGDIKCKFTSDEPYTISKQKWLDLADGKDNVYLYCGNGDGCITLEGDNLVFTGAPSGSGGDVHAEISIPRHLVSDKLKLVIENASKAGLKFSDS